MPHPGFEPGVPLGSTPSSRAILWIIVTDSKWTPDRKRQYEREYYAANVRDRKERVRAQREAVKQRYRSLIEGYLSQHPCVDCGEGDIVVLDFDHLPGCTKSFNIGSAWDKKVDLILAEIEKCEVVCANCHRRRTCQRSNGWRIAPIS